MLKKSLAFSILAAGLLIAPTAAFAGEQSQSQKNVQITDQNGAAVNHSVNSQSADSVNIQQQILKQNRYGGRSYVCAKPSTTNQAQSSTQITGQNGAAVDSSANVQASSTSSAQNQIALGNTGCFYRF
ncbi:MAG: hypothetical protein N2235_19995 [Fischerella sp.]|nr:hypothetical protein [Fischerella sp.]